MMPTRSALRAGAGAALAMLLGCSPTLDWRDVRPEGSGLRALFPCKPGSHARDLHMPGVPVKMSMYACEAGGATFALGFADTGDAARAGALLGTWRDAARVNVDGQLKSEVTTAVAGATPAVAASRATVSGRLPSGGAVEVALMLFSRDGLAYQATVFGAQLDADAIDTFFTALKFDV